MRPGRARAGPCTVPGAGGGARSRPGPRTRGGRARRRPRAPSRATARVVADERREVRLGVRVGRVETNGEAELAERRLGLPDPKQGEAKIVPERGVGRDGRDGQTEVREGLGGAAPPEQRPPQGALETDPGP